MLENDHAFTFTAYDIISENGEPLQKTVTAPAQLNYNEALKNTIIGCLTVMLDLQTSRTAWKCQTFEQGRT